MIANVVDRSALRLLRQALNLLAGCLLAITLLAPLVVQAAEAVEVVEASLENSDEGYKLNVSYSFELPRALEDAVNRGVPLYFTTEVELARPRWYWFDEKTVRTSHTIRISYNVLTQQYHAASAGRLQQSFGNLEDALSVVRRPRRWVIVEKGVLKPGEGYNLSLRMGLDVTRLPKPFQVHALNSSGWRFSSDWKHFSFRAE